MEPFARLYESMGGHGFGPRQVDEMELWEAASVLGMHKAENAEAAMPAGGGRDIVAERLEAKRTGGPAPKPDRPKQVDPRVLQLVRQRKGA